MPAVELLPGLKYQVKKDDLGNLELFEIKKRLFEDNIEVQNLKTGITQTILEQDIIKKLFDGTLQLEVQGKNTKEPEPGKLRTDFVWQDITELKPKRFVVTLGRYFILTEFMKLAGKATEKEALPSAIKKGMAVLRTKLREMVDDQAPKGEADDQKEIALLLMKLEKILPPPTLSTVRNWRMEYVRSGMDIRSLVPYHDNCGAPGKTRRSNRLDDLIRLAFDTVYMKKQRGSIKQVHDELETIIKKENHSRPKSDKLPVPRLRSLYDWIDRQNDKEVLIARFGRKMAKNAYRSTGAGVKTTHPLERAEFDDTELPMFLIDDIDGMPIGKAILTFGLDHNTAYPLGLHLSFHSPSAATTGECLRHAIEPKTYVASKYKNIKREWNAYGVPYTIAVDLGKGYQAILIRNSCLQLVTDVLDCPVRTPHYKGRVERFFRTIKELLLKGLPGITFNDIFDRSDYNPQEDAVISLNGFLELLHIFTIEIYAQDWHDGVGGVPQKLWDKGIKNVPRRYPPNAAEMRVIMAHTEYRELHHYGFDLWHIRYNDPNNVELALLRRLAEQQSSDEEKKFKIKVDLWDLSHIHVYDHFNNRYIRVPAVDQEYTANLSYYKHRFVLKELNRQKVEQVDQEALRKARNKLKAVIAREYTSARRARTRKRLACFLGKSDSLLRTEEDINYEETIEEHIQEPCKSKAFDGASDFGAGQNAKAQNRSGETELTQGKVEVTESSETAATARPETPSSPRRGVFYSQARRTANP